MSKPQEGMLKALIKGGTPIIADIQKEKANQQDEQGHKPKYTPEQVEKMLDQQTGITDDTSWIVSDSAKDHPDTPTHFQLPETKTPEPKKIKHKLVELQDREFEI